MKYCLHFILAIILLSCKADEELSIEEFEVTVVGTGIDCKLPLIDFQEEDLDKVGKLTGSQPWSTYQVFNLDSAYHAKGLILHVVVRQTQDNELFPCTALGPGYPWVTVLSARISN